NLAEGDARLGMFQTPDTSGVIKALDRQALKTIGVLPPTSDPGGDMPPPSEETKIASAAPPTPRRSSRATQPPADLQIYDRIPWKDYPAALDSSKPETLLLAFTESELQTITPRSAEQALRSKSADQWREAMNREKQCHLKNGTFFGEEWSGPGPCLKPVPAGWVFKIKHRGAPIEGAKLASQTVQGSCRDPWPI